MSRGEWRYHTCIKSYGNNLLELKLPFLKKINRSSVELICSAIDKEINCTMTSSAGRLFDAVAALINLCPYSKFHAEAPMRLESIIENKTNQFYSCSISKTISFDPTIEQIVKDLKRHVPLPEISAKFHNTVISVIYEVVKKIRRRL